MYHPHSELHHIKKENIGLIEVVGLAVLPSRLKEEMKLLSEAMRLCAVILPLTKELIHIASGQRLVSEKHKDINSANVDEILRKKLNVFYLGFGEMLVCLKETS